MKSAQWTIGLVVVGALAVSCNALTGLSDYEKVDCVGACGDAGDAGKEVGPEVGSEVGPEAGNDVVVDVADEDALEADVVDSDVSDADVVTYDAIELGPVNPTLRWAQWPMPHRDGAGDATIVEIEAGYHDDVTKLMWSTSHPLKETLGQAEARCKTVGRLPTRIELASLLEPGLVPPYDTTVGDMESGPYWTSSEVFDPNATQQLFWVVDFQTGRLEKQDPFLPGAHVRCIATK